MPNLQSGENQAGKPFWNRPLTRRQALIACFIVGSLATFAMMAIGDYQLKHRPPGAGDILVYVLIAIALGPLLVLAASLKSRSLRRLLFHNDPQDG
jgi:hypothetical protein